MDNMGFVHFSGISDHNFSYKSQETDIDDFYAYENIVFIIEYTTEKDVSEHLYKKKVFYDLVNNSHSSFIDFLMNDQLFVSYKDYIEHKNYSNNQIHIRFLYCSIKPVSLDCKKQLENNHSVVFMDLDTVQYFKLLASIIKRTSRYEFFTFAKINYSDIGSENDSDVKQHSVYRGEILPVEKSFFNPGYNVISFYIDANSLMRRAYVLRQESWRMEDSTGFYQRMLRKDKISKMRKYLSTKQRVFINNIIATLSKDNVKLIDANEKEIEIDEKGNFIGNEKGYDKIKPTKIQIEDCPNVIGIIDGQHRVFAYHEGTDNYENRIKLLRNKQHLLVTAVLFPKTEDQFERQKFEATLFKEINNNQTNISSYLKHKIELIISPFSPTAISESIILKLKDNGPLCGHISNHSYDKGMLKTASIVSFGIVPLVKYDDSQDSDSLFKLWEKDEKQSLKATGCSDHELKKEYIDYCTKELLNLIIALRRCVSDGSWHTYDPKTRQGILSVTFINGFLNVVRCLIKDQNITLSSDGYYEKMKNIDFEELKRFKSSQYNKMGRFIYDNYFKNV